VSQVAFWIPATALCILASVRSFASDTLPLTMDAALRLAMRRSPARAEVRAARTQAWVRPAQGIASLLPTPSGSYGWARAETRDPLNPDTTVTTEGWAGTLTLSQVVFDPQVFAGVASSIVYSGYYAADARDKQARLVYDVTADYLGLLKARLLRDAAAQALARAGDNLELARERVRLGSASEIEALRSEAFHSQAQVNLLSAGKAMSAANAGLLATLGLNDPVVVRPTEELVEPAGFEFSDSESLVSEIERRNPGARLAARVGAAAAVSLAAAIGRALPSISAYWRSSYSDTLLPRTGSDWTDRDGISVGISFAFPLLDLKSYVLNIADAAAESRRARAAADRARLGLRAAATAAVLGYLEARERLDYAARNLKLNEELYRLAREQHRLGGMSLLDIFSVETGLTQAQAAHVSALCDTYIEAAQVSYLLGRSSPPLPAR
jgi:outer membrane protein TolC